MKVIKSALGKMGPFLALIVLFIILSIASDSFLTVNNMMNILKQTAVNGLISAGMLIVLITGGIDLSVGANAVSGACLMGLLMQKFQVTNAAVLIIVCLLFGAGIGLLNGVLLTKLHLPHPFVSTLGVKNALCGLALLLVASKTVGGFPSAVTWIGGASIFATDSFAGIPVCFIALLIIFAGFHVMLTKTSFGISVYCVGGNAEAARLSGINADRVLNTVYMISGLVCGFAGLVIVGRTGVANPTAAISPYDTDAIAACILGGASFLGGKGTIGGTLIGALIIATIRNGLTLMNAASDVQYIVIGVVIIVAVFIDVTRTALEAKQRRLAAE